MTASDVPFSARNRGQHKQIDNAFPDGARMALLHILHDLEERNYVSGWKVVARELQRIARMPPQSYGSSVSASDEAKLDVENIVEKMSWEGAYDFCERLYGHLAQDDSFWDGNDTVVRTPKSEVKAYIEAEIRRIFLEEGLAYEFSGGVVRRRGRKHSVEQTSRAQVVLGDRRLDSARKHYEKALQFFRNPIKPDFENCVKEAVCAVEAAGKALFPEAKASTLGDLVKWFNSNSDYSVPKALTKTIEGTYAYRSGGDGIGHGGAAGGVATVEVAEYVLSVCASQIIFLVDIERSNDEPPF